MSWLLLLACRCAPAEAPRPAPPVFQGACDASAAWAAPDGTLWVADDESDQLGIYAPTGGPPVRTLVVRGVEGDLEGAAALGPLVWWMGSHGRSDKGKPRPERQVLFATDAAGAVVARQTDLLDRLRAHPTLGQVVAAAEPLPPKEGGVAIEGLAAREDQLWVGFRSPLTDGRAWVAALTPPRGDVPGSWGEATALDLGGRGIRSLEWDPTREIFWVVAGPPGRADGTFALFRWAGPGAAPAPVDADLADFTPEALVVTPTGLLVLSDDGRRTLDGVDCKTLPPAQRRFRARAIPF